MPWLIGIDEAGYGPNLGPLVMTSVACRVADGWTGADLWQHLAAAVRRAGDPADGRLLIEDSKLVYLKGKLPRLEAGVLATVVPLENGARTLAACLGRVAPAACEELAREPWYHGTTALPLAARRAELNQSAARFAHTCAAAGVLWGGVHSVIVCPARFNHLVDRFDSKSAVLGVGLQELLRANLVALPGGEPVALCIDKHGGRNNYAALLQDGVPAGTVIAHEETAERSAYSVVGAGHDVSLVFEPRADARHFCVALASMTSKYLREVLMHEFNTFWAQHVPELQPTAGYPQDAKRYYAAIQPVLAQLGIEPDRMWRRR